MSYWVDLFRKQAWLGLRILDTFTKQVGFESKPIQPNTHDSTQHEPDLQAQIATPTNTITNKL